MDERQTASSPAEAFAFMRALGEMHGVTMSDEDWERMLDADYCTAKGDDSIN